MIDNAIAGKSDALPPYPVCIRNTQTLVYKLGLAVASGRLQQSLVAAARGAIVFRYTVYHEIDGVGERPKVL